MEVILRQAVEKLGQPGDVVKVSAGFARNYLLPRGIAYAATPGNLKRIAQEKARLEAAEDERRGSAQGIATRSEHKEITVLFADLKGFTALAERLEPDRLVRLLNGYFAVMSDAIAAHRGHLAKQLAVHVRVQAVRGDVPPVRDVPGADEEADGVAHSGDGTGLSAHRGPDTIRTCGFRGERGSATSSRASSSARWAWCRA